METNLAQFKQYRFQCVVCFIMCCCTWLTLSFADAYAWYLLDVNADLDSNPFKYFGRRDTLIHPYNLLFLMPFAVVVFNKYTIKTRIAWMIVSLLLMGLSFLLIGEGGDRQGCKDCFGFFLIYIGVLPIPAILSVLWGGYKATKNSANRINKA